MEYRSENIDEIIGMLMQAEPELTAIVPDKTNNRGGQYISRDHMITSANRILSPLGGRVIPVSRHKDGAGMILGIHLVHKKSNQFLISDYTVDEHIDFSSGDANWKKGGSITYGMRYIIGSMLGISLGEDDYTPEEKPSSGKYATGPQVGMLNAKFAKYPDLKNRVFSKLEITDMANVPFEKVTGIVEWLDKELKERAESGK